MALFNTPSLLDVIWRKETFPQDGGGFTGLMDGLSNGMQAREDWKTEKADKAAKDASPLYAPSQVQTPAPIAPGAQVAPAAMPQTPTLGGFAAGAAGFGGIYSSINKLINAMRPS
jgi:hypothetical protein